jgi:hypothetical protein
MTVRSSSAKSTADEKDRVAEIKVGHRAWVSVGAEALLERVVGGRRAEARVAVEVGRPDSGTGDQRERVVVLEEELAAVVEGRRERAALVEGLPTAPGDEAHRRLPRCRLQLAVTPHERLRQAVGRVVCLPAVEPLGAEPPVVDAVFGPAAHADDATVLDGDVEPAVVGAEDAGRLDPAIDLVLRHREVLVDAHGPFAARREGPALAPGVRDPVVHRSTSFPERG